MNPLLIELLRTCESRSVLSVARAGLGRPVQATRTLPTGSIAQGGRRRETPPADWSSPCQSLERPPAP
jgi:hypothetical protein